MRLEGESGLGWMKDVLLEVQALGDRARGVEKRILDLRKSYPSAAIDYFDRIWTGKLKLTPTDDQLSTGSDLTNAFLEGRETVLLEQDLKYCKDRVEELRKQVFGATQELRSAQPPRKHR
jgi:hypothetical protein